MESRIGGRCGRATFVSIDTGCKVNGWCGDAAVTLAIGPVRPEVQKLLDVTSETLNLAIRAMGRCKTWLEVASLMERFVKSQGLYVVEKFVGHGIGQTMHEEPQVPNFVSYGAAAARYQARAGHRAGDRADGRAGNQRSPHPCPTAGPSRPRTAARALTLNTPSP